MKKGVLALKFVFIVLICFVCVFVLYNSIPVKDKWLSEDVFKIFEDFKFNFIK